jgi:hypothetical protein
VSKNSRRVEAARKKVVPAAEDLVHTAADRVGPLAHSAAEKVGPFAGAAADVIGAAADKVSPLAHSAADRVGPLALSAADRVGPLAQSAADKLAPLAGQAVDRVTPYAKEAADRVSPYTQTAAAYAQTAAQRIAPVAASAKQRGAHVTERITPVLDDALEKVPPAVAAARGKVAADVLPKIGAALSAAAASPVVEEVGSRAEATLAAAKGELVMPKKKGRWVKRLVIVGAMGAVVVVVVRKFLGSQDVDWQAARPATPYAPSVKPESPTLVEDETVPDQPAEGGEQTTEPTAETAAAEEDFAATQPLPEPRLDDQPSSDEPPAGGPAVEETVVDEVVFEEPVAELPETEHTTEPASDQPPPRYSGEGVYVGTEPPEGYVIKGNERSKKYHVPESGGYARTVAEVWFNSEEAAQQAGFVRAQR